MCKLSKKVIFQNGLVKSFSLLPPKIFAFDCNDNMVDFIAKYFSTTYRGQSELKEVRF